MHESPDSIDRESALPACVQLVNILRGQVATGKYRPGDHPPSESEPCARCGMSP